MSELRTTVLNALHRELGAKMVPFAGYDMPVQYPMGAGCKDADIARMKEQLTGCEVVEVTDRALLALQGPQAEAVLEALVPGVAAMRFMDVAIMDSDWGELWLSRSGYTGEDGYEISVPEGQAEAFARKLLEQDAVAPIGLGARDSLRLEAGLCLYGHDIDSDTNPAEAALGWAIQKIRRSGGAREGGFPGAGVILPELVNGSARRRVGLRPEGRAPMREGTPLFADAEGGDQIGVITSGAFGPTIEGPMSMGYLPSDLATPGTQVYGEVRGKRQPAQVAALPFTKANFKR